MKSPSKSHGQHSEVGKDGTAVLVRELHEIIRKIPKVLFKQETINHRQTKILPKLTINRKPIEIVLDIFLCHKNMRVLILYLQTTHRIHTTQNCGGWFLEKFVGATCINDQPLLSPFLSDNKGPHLNTGINCEVDEFCGVKVCNELMVFPRVVGKLGI